MWAVICHFIGAREASDVFSHTHDRLHVTMHRTYRAVGLLSDYSNLKLNVQYEC